MNIPEAAGITVSLPFQEYLRLPGLSASAIKKIMRSPLAYKWSLDHPDTASTPAMALGTAAHTAILEPHRFADQYAIWDGDRRGKAWTDFKEAQAAKSIITASEYADVMGMRDALQGYEPAARYLQNGIAEVTIQWIDRATGRPFKGRIDWLTVVDGRVVLVDLKSTRSTNPRKFGADAYKLGYHIQFALYVDGWFHLTGDTPLFKVLAAESKPPYEPAVFDVTEDVLAQGHEEYMSLLAMLKACEDTNTWPPALQEEQELTLPVWASTSDDDLSDIGLDLSA